ncbi:phasin family protein [Teichococcus vastitatis]|uniref:phasin family protein n=1 Tax=Teichococcus vastitatis TaxID=2307076 RepID=UPI00130077ED|nr:phasin family protein [Pseudoroseomonas vastitatis]
MTAHITHWQPTADAMSKTTQAATELGRSNLEALTQSAQASVAGMQDLGRLYVAAVQGLMQQAMESTKAFAGARTLQDVLAVQANLTRASFSAIIPGLIRSGSTSSMRCPTGSLVMRSVEDGEDSMGTTQTDTEAPGYAEFDQTSQKISDEVSDSMRRVLRSPKHGSAYAENAPQEVSRLTTSAVAAIHQRPFASLLAAGAFGWVLGLLAGRQR